MHEEKVSKTSFKKFDFRRISRRNPWTINAAITSAVGVISRVYQPGATFPAISFLQVPSFCLPALLEVVRLRGKVRRLVRSQ